jgi:hypothetical protein
VDGPHLLKYLWSLVTQAKVTVSFPLWNCVVWKQLEEALGNLALSDLALAVGAWPLALGDSPFADEPS